MAIVDATYKSLGAKGRFSDGGIFSGSALEKRLEKGQDLPADAPLYDGGRLMPFVVVRDAAFPLMKHLMRPYPGRQASGNRRLENFNYRSSRARRIVKNAFGILCARWRV
ncbi:DDE superfamily endonuclease [Popillia japonica]|uniref:DDE superfamily endonuclease n=1 Tax=Popillia japonica TaxID=7064 RepID=A0AAW1JD88_POPJA